MKRFFAGLSILMLLPIFMIGQSQAKLHLAQRFVAAELTTIGLQKNDVKDMVVTDHYTTKHNGLTHIYFNQTYKGIPIINATMNLNITKNNIVGHYTSDFVSDVKSKINVETSTLDPDEAIVRAAIDNGIVVTKNNLKLIGKLDAQYSKYEGGEISKEDIPVRLKYYLTDEGQLKLVYDIDIRPKANSDHWSTRVDVTTGDIVNKYNNTVYCNFGANHQHHSNDHASLKRDVHAV